MENLADILCRKTEYYLTCDNKEQITKKDKLIGFFSHCGKEGRQRAKDYKQNILNAFYANELDLLATVVKDLNFEKQYNPANNKIDKRLGSSSLYRRRLMEGLCEYFDINNQAEQITQKRYSKACALMTYGAPYPSHQDIRDQVMLDCINIYAKRALADHHPEAPRVSATI